MTIRTLCIVALVLGLALFAESCNSKPAGSTSTADDSEQGDSSATSTTDGLHDPIALSTQGLVDTALNAEESWQPFKISIKGQAFIAERIILKERTYVITTQNEVLPVSDKLDRIFDDSYLLCMQPVGDAQLLEGGALSIAAIGYFQEHVTMDLIEQLELWKDGRINAISYTIGKDSFTRRSKYKSPEEADDNAQQTYYFLNTRNVTRSDNRPTPKLALLIPPDQLYQSYLNLVNMKAAASSEKKILLASTPIRRSISIRGNSYNLERLQLAEATFTPSREQQLLSLVRGWRLLYHDKDAKDNFVDSDFEYRMKMTFTGLRGGDMKIEVSTSGNKIICHLVDLKGEDTKMDYFCYRAIPRGSKEKAVVIALPFDFEKIPRNP